MGNDSHYIHETIVRDIIDIATTVQDVSDGNMRSFSPDRSTSFRSVASASDKLTLVFPVLISNSLGISAASIVAKAIERKCVSMMQMLFSAVNIDNATNAIDYIAKFHTNLDTGKVTIDSLMDALDSLNVEESTSLHESTAQFRERLMAESAVKDDYKNNTNFTLPNSVNETSLNKYKFESNSNHPIVVNELSDEDAQDAKQASDYFSKQLVPSDVKKANELVPTMVTVRFTSYDGENPIPVDNIMIGIKAKMYPLDSFDIINRVRMKNQDNNGFNKFIKATTREISFFKDFLFAIDKAKLDALSTSRRGSSNKLWKVLERRSAKSKMRRVFRMTNTAAAISTLVISKEESEYLKKNYGINIEDPNVMRPIMESYNLMGVVIVDEANEIASFMFDSGDDMYEQLSFNNLEREANDGEAKKVINLMTKIAR